MNISLSEHFNYKKLLKFVFPSVLMMIFTSIYGIVDGLFVSNFVGKTPFAAVNFIMPFLMILGAVGFMIGTGGSAIVSKTLGEGKKEEANRYFSLLVYITVILGLILTVLGIIFMRSVTEFLGAEGELADNCVIYGRIVLIALSGFMLQNVFQSFLITAEKPQLGLGVTVAAGVANMILDWLFIAVFNWGLVGAAVATAISQMIGGFVPLVYFARDNSSLLRLTKTVFYGKVFFKTFTNGSSELMNNISMSLVSMLYNFRLMKICGENGVAAYGVIMYVNFIFAAVFIGYSIGSAPIIGYHFGAKNHDELKNLLKKSTVIIGILSIVLTAVSIIFAYPLSKIFVGYDKELLELTTRGFILYSLSFLICGFNIFGSAFFTALNNGLVSAVISFLRTLVFQISMVLILPIFWGIDGIWLSIVFAELPALVVTIIYLISQKDKYKYL